MALKSRAHLEERVCDLEELVRKMHAEIVTLRACVSDAGGNVAILRRLRGRKEYYRILTQSERRIIRGLVNLKARA